MLLSPLLKESKRASRLAQSTAGLSKARLAASAHESHRGVRGLQWVEIGSPGAEQASKLPACEERLQVQRHLELLISSSTSLVGESGFCQMQQKASCPERQGRVGWVKASMRSRPAGVPVSDVQSVTWQGFLIRFLYGGSELLPQERCGRHLPPGRSAVGAGRGTGSSHPRESWQRLSRALVSLLDGDPCRKLWPQGTTQPEQRLSPGPCLPYDTYTCWLCVYVLFVTSSPYYNNVFPAPASSPARNASCANKKGHIWKPGTASRYSTSSRGSSTSGAGQPSQSPLSYTRTPGSCRPHTASTPPGGRPSSTSSSSTRSS